MQPWMTAFTSRSDLEVYGDNALGLFTLALKFGLDDLETIAADAITDGNDDKKADIVYVDGDEGIAVIAQCYYSSKDRDKAPANKASDLNTAIGWLLQRDINKLPERLVSQARELRSCLQTGKIQHLYIWYVHNLPESANVMHEMQTVESTAHAALKHQFPNNPINLTCTEIGTETLDQLYAETLTPILVNDSLKVEISNGFEISGPEWKAFVTAIPARFLHRVYKKHKTALFSANVRDYLGSRSSDSNINNGIKNTVENDPSNFWVFNNGLTVLVNSYDEEYSGKNSKLIINGMSIVNGAQTTGAIGSITNPPSDDALVPVRFVKTNNPEIVHSIVHFNNSQNKVTAADFRSTDRVQKRLKDEIDRIPNAEYEGGRRGGYSDAIKRRPNLMSSYTVGQSLMAIHGDPVIAYNQKSNIWIDDKHYSKIFNDETTGSHIVFAHGLLRAIESKKMALVHKSKLGIDSLTETEAEQLSFFRKRGSIYLFMSAIAACLEIFSQKRIYSLFKVSFKESVSPHKSHTLWLDVIEITSPLAIHLNEGLDDGLKSKDKVSRAIQTFRTLVQVTSTAHIDSYRKFSTELIIKS